MKIKCVRLFSAPRVFAISAVLLVANPLALHAKEKDNNFSLGNLSQILQGVVRGNNQNQSENRSENQSEEDAVRRTGARTIPGYVLVPGNGYAGRGYYYGPPNTSYYERGQGVRYFSAYEDVPREYRGTDQRSSRNNRRDNVSIGASVQQALARNGYYNGSVDGVIGAKSRRSIAAYQQDNGLAVTGEINSALLASLGL